MISHFDINFGLHFGVDSDHCLSCVGAPCRTALRTLRVLALCFLSYCLHSDLCKYEMYKENLRVGEGTGKVQEGDR